MRITIDNLDGAGARDYTGIVAAEGAVTIERGLNTLSRCTALVVLEPGGLPMPARKARVVVTAESGVTLFTGYLATEPVREYAGEASEGAVYRARLSAVSDEWLLDKLGSGASAANGPVLALNGGALVERLVQRVDGAALSVDAASGVQATGSFAVRSAKPWSVNAGAAAGAAYAGYRALGGSVLVSPAGATTHAWSDADGTLSVSELALGNVRELANDVTLSGAEEARAYVTECQLGDGTTTVFTLNDNIFRESSRTLLQDSFSGAVIDTTQWLASDPAGHISLTSAGLTVSGGTGADGVTMLTALDAIEMSGTVVAELSSVELGTGSDGMLAGFYQGPVSLAACFAGFRVKQVGGVTTVVPVVNGAETGSSFTAAAGHAYTFRLRLHCAEMQRVMQRYYAMVDGVVEGFGALGGVDAPMDVAFDVVDQGVSSSTPATVLYDSVAADAPIVSSPATCAFVAMDSVALVGSIGAVRVTRPGSLWVSSILPDGSQITRLEGVAGEGVDFSAGYGSATGTPAKLTFFAGRVPVPGERLVVRYRTGWRAIARLADAASVAAEAATGAPGTSRWLGKVLQPAARSSTDCESAAQAVLAFATSRAAAVAGKYAAVNPASDVWPGDVLAITSAGTTTSVLVRSVTVEDGAAEPEVLRYRIAFANDWATEWADGLGLKLSEAIASDAELPVVAADGAVEVLANLQQLSVTTLTTTAIGIDAGMDPPSGGGFEVRRRDDAFGVGTDAADLVLRSPVRGFDIPRTAQAERYFVRMYDASVLPVYSRWSSAVVVNAPMG